MGTTCDAAKWPENMDNVRILPYVAFVCLFYHYATQVFFCFELEFLSSGCGHAGLLFTKQKKAGS